MPVKTATPDKPLPGEHQRFFRRILGVQFYVGEIDGLLAQTLNGGLIVVPSAPVLVHLAEDPAHRAAVENSDLAVTDSGFLMLLWRFFKHERLIRISGLKYVRYLLGTPAFREPGATFWIMPTAQDAAANQSWLKTQGIVVPESAIYLAPHYPRQGPLEDAALLAAIQAYRPRFVMINLGGNVQERLGYYLRQNLAKPDSTPLFASANPGSVSETSALKSLPSTVHRSPPTAPLPALICTGAAIAFLSGRQANIPPWADRLYLGWLLRSLREPRKFLPRYWYALRLLPLVWKHGERSVSDHSSEPGQSTKS